MRVFLGAHGARLTARGIIQPGLLAHLAARFPDLDLAQCLRLHRMHHEAHGVDILDLAARAERLARLAHRDVDIRAHGAFLHIAVARAEIAQDLPDLAQIRAGLLGRADVRLGDDFHQRHAGAVEVDHRFGNMLVMHGFTRILLQMQPGDADMLDRAVLQLDLDIAGAHDRLLELADLIAIGQIGIKIVLAVKARDEVDLRLQPQPGAHRLGHAFAVDDRQHPGKARIHEADMRIGRAAISGRGAGEEF